MYININNFDIYDEYRMSDQYRLEEEYAREQAQIERDEYRSWKKRKDRYVKLKKIKSVVAGMGIHRIPINDDDIPF